jgi:hypothetical protein
MPRILPLVFGLVGLGLLVGAGFTATNTRNLLAVAEEVPGVVVDYTTSTSDGSTTYSPVYEYEFEGRTYRHETNVSTSGRPTVGETETILVDPADPSEAMPDTFMDKWFLPVLLGGMGILFTGIAVLVVVVSVVKGGISRAASALEDAMQERATAMGVTTSDASAPASHTVAATTAGHDDHDPFVDDDEPKTTHSGPFL